MAPNTECIADEPAREVLRKWLANRYARAALPADSRALELMVGPTDPLRAAILITLAWVQRLIWETDEARTTLSDLQDLCDRLGSSLHRGYALCLEGDLLLDDGEVESARQRYIDAQVLGHQLGEPSLRVRPWVGMSRAARVSGDTATGTADAERAVAEAREVGYEWLLGVALSELGAALRMTGDRVGALERLDEAAAILERREARYSLAACRLQQAAVLRDLGQNPMDAFGSCLALARAEGYEHLLLSQEATVAVPLLADAVRAGLGGDDAVRLLARSGRRDIVESLLGEPSDTVRLRALAVLRELADGPALTALAAAHDDPAKNVSSAARGMLDELLGAGPPPLQVETLGAFRVRRGDEPIDGPAWGGSRIKDLFKLLVVHRGQPLIRDVAAEALWPDLPADTALNNLNVTMSALRRVLEPWLRSRQPSAYIISEEGAYRLVPGTYSVDADRFAEAAGTALVLAAAEDWEAVIGPAREARDAYAGTFLAENRYDDWAVVEAERLANMYGDMLFAMARACAALGNLDEACDRARELLHLQPFAEEVHRFLMRCLSRRGRRAEALYHYNECRRLLEEELGVAVSRTTRDLHRQLVAGEDV
jgi:DNA-binding SARP family transcriptional activator